MAGEWDGWLHNAVATVPNGAPKAKPWLPEAEGRGEWVEHDGKAMPPELQPGTNVFALLRWEREAKFYRPTQLTLTERVMLWAGKPEDASDVVAWWRDW